MDHDVGFFSYPFVEELVIDPTNQTAITAVNDLQGFWQIRLILSLVAREVGTITTSALAGITGGAYTTPTGVNLTLAEGTAQAEITDPANLMQLGEQWFAFKSELAGDFHSHYDVRAYVKASTYLQRNDTVAMYPKFGSSLTFSSGQSYLHGKPQVTGFWSLKVYGANNSLNRFALGDRSNITHEDGTLVYGGNSSDDHPFALLLQSNETAPPSNWTSK
ncbi:hypothetical protein C8J56DRAFT_264569 [Mycena floridula]|nr:hypothetical protein C8J56DRAFT_264569 [Mycena floridula]